MESAHLVLQGVYQHFFFQNGKKHLKQQHEQLLASTSVAAFKDFCGVFCSLCLGEDEQLQHE